MDPADFEGLLGFLSEVELEVDMLRDEYSSLWPASQTSQAILTATEHLDFEYAKERIGILMLIRTPLLYYLVVKV
eukprot:SM000076S21809  [mRNA]  locus=s76:325124:325482:- [translate_table: standard]